MSVKMMPGTNSKKAAVAVVKKSGKEVASKQKGTMKQLPAEPPEKQKVRLTTAEPPEKQKVRLTTKDVQMRAVRQEELHLVVALMAGEEEWRVSADDLLELMEAYPQCIWGAFSSTSGQLLGCCQLSPMDGNTAFLSHLITHPQHRGKGVASLVLKRARTAAGERTLLLAVTVDMQPVMERWGFHFSRHHICSCDGKPRLPENYAPPASSVIKIQPITFELMADVQEFDQSVCGIDRSHAMRALLTSARTVAGLCAWIGEGDNKKLDGFVFLRKENAGSGSGGETVVRLSAFYAESLDTARALMYEVVARFVAPTNSSLVSWFSTVNMDRCRKLYRDFGMDDPETQFRLMYSERDVNVPWSKVYAIYEHYANLV